MTPQASACEDRRWLKSISMSHYDYNDQPNLRMVEVAVKKLQTGSGIGGGPIGINSGARGCATCIVDG